MEPLSPETGQGREGAEGRLQGDAREPVSQPSKGVSLTEELRAAPAACFSAAWLVSGHHSDYYLLVECPQGTCWSSAGRQA